jgi:hypothetical protein
VHGVCVRKDTIFCLEPLHGIGEIAGASTLSRIVSGNVASLRLSRSFSLGIDLLLLDELDHH